MRRALCIAAVVLVVLPARAQDDHGFRFVRVRFENGGGRSFGGAPWSHDYPTAEENFYVALKRTTAVHVEEPYLVLELNDDRIFNHPVLYLCEPGHWTMTDEEAERLRQYLQRGGFILFDDFGGEGEWAWFAEQMERVLPGAEPAEIPPEHPIWSIYYDVDPVAAPSLVSRRTWVQGEDQYLAYFDDAGRMIALANYNQDLGDGWEWPERNFDDASTVSFQMGINYVIYALTH